MRASPVMAMPCAVPLSSSTARATGFSRVPWQVGQAASLTSSTSGSAKDCSRPFSSAASTESSSALRCSLVSLTPVPTQSGHQPCLLL